ncbi:MAG: hypothetical protein BroJett018_26730 [Chloroflexota bacterium]|nr:MAG: hypothetical protein BroJett018_26730 [Chloroflexota bacterium]
MGHLSDVVKREMKSYAGSGTHTKLYAILDDAAQIYSVNVVDYSPQRRPARVVLMARIVDDRLFSRPILQIVLSCVAWSRQASPAKKSFWHTQVKACLMLNLTPHHDLYFKLMWVGVSCSRFGEREYLLTPLSESVL